MERAAAQSVDPSRLLSIGEAARLVGVSESTLRRRMRSGELLHEVVRGDGRERPMVRFVDLADAYPDVLWPAPRATDSVTVPPAPTPAPTPAHARPVEAQRGGAADTQTLVRLASVQTAHDALAGQIADLQGQREDLKEQCSDLRGRLTIVERERQAGTAGLLMAQKRLLELDAARPSDPTRWYARSSTWGLVAAACVLAWFLRGQIVEAEELDEQRAALSGALASELAGRAGDAEAFERGLAATLEAARLELGREREAARAEREQFVDELDETRAEAGQLLAALADERAVAEAERARFAEQLREETEQARRALREERAAADEERRRLGAELELARERAAEERAESAALLASMRDGVGTAQATAAALAAELARAQAEARRADERVRELESELAPRPSGWETISAPLPWWARLWRSRAPESAERARESDAR